MEQELTSALLLMLIGMITVFSILLLVVFTGKLLIYLVNRFGEEKLKLKPASYHLPFAKETINKKEIAVIMAAIEVATNGKGKVRSIKKLR